ncbi:MAG: 30S ribosomal protein S8 [Mycoplasma sp.]|nr:30S ribosomal protein S8 [Mycoplasma sp.]
MARVITDPIGDMLIRIKNASQRKHQNVLIPYSKIKFNILNILRDEGFIVDFKVDDEDNITKKALNVELKYKNNQRIILGVKRVSKPGLKVYSEAKKIPQVPGFGIVIMSTSKGLMTDRKARQLNLGGEVLAYIW